MITIHIVGSSYIKFKAKSFFRRTGSKIISNIIGKSAWTGDCPTVSGWVCNKTKSTRNVWVIPCGRKCIYPIRTTGRYYHFYGIPHEVTMPTYDLCIQRVRKPTQT
jgi:hypothetical protein